MSEFNYETLQITRHGSVVRVNLHRPDVRNAFNEQMIADLTDAFSRLGADTTIRAIVLGGTGKVFCAGADVDWMRRSADRTEADNVADAQAMAKMYRTIDECPAPVIGRVQRAAFGGAIGLVAVCDVVVAERGAKLCFSEVRLGILPAVISTFVIAKIGASQARRYFLTAEVFTAEDAPPGLIHAVVEPDVLESTVEHLVKSICENGPQAVREAKAVIPKVAAMERGAAIDFCAETIARVRVTDEAQEGLRAFLDKREPSWRSGGKE